MSAVTCRWWRVSVPTGYQTATPVTIANLDGWTQHYGAVVEEYRRLKAFGLAPVVDEKTIRQVRLKAEDIEEYGEGRE